MMMTGLVSVVAVLGIIAIRATTPSVQMVIAGIAGAGLLALSFGHRSGP